MSEDETQENPKLPMTEQWFKENTIPRDPNETLTFPTVPQGVGQAMYDRHPRVQQLLGFMGDQAGESTVGRYVHDLGMWAMQRLPDDPELAIALRKLLEAQACLMRVEKIRDARGQ